MKNHFFWVSSITCVTLTINVLHDPGTQMSSWIPELSTWAWKCQDPWPFYKDLNQFRNGHLNSLQEIGSKEQLQLNKTAFIKWTWVCCSPTYKVLNSGCQLSKSLSDNREADFPPSQNPRSLSLCASYSKHFSLLLTFQMVLILILSFMPFPRKVSCYKCLMDKSPVLYPTYFTEIYFYINGTFQNWKPSLG